MIAASLAPSVQNLHYPGFNLSWLYTERLGCFVDWRAILGRASSGLRNHSAVRTLRFIVSVHRLPQRYKAHEECSTAEGVAYLCEQIQCRDAGRMLTFEFEI